MQNLKRSILVAAMFAAIPSAAFASSARIDGMNVPGDYVKDYTGIFTYLSGVTGVGNLVYGEFGDANYIFGSPFDYKSSRGVQPSAAAGYGGPGGGIDRSMGAVLNNIADGKWGSFGVFLREGHPGLGQASAAGKLNPGIVLGHDPNEAGESMDILWGKQFGKTALGLRLNRTFFKEDDGTDEILGTDSDERNIMGFGAGVGFEMGENTAIEVSGLFQSRTFDDGSITEDGGGSYLFAARAMHRMNGNIMLVPVAKIYNFDLSETDGTTAIDQSESGFQVGVAGNWSIGNNDLIVLGAQFAQNKYKLDDFEATETLMPNVFLSVETMVNNWLTLRMGAQKPWMYSYKEDDGTDEETINTSYLLFNFGAGVKVGSLQFDTTLDPFFYHNPAASFLGGDEAVIGSGVPFVKVTGTYSW
jgi:hypothetical protein